MNLAEIEKIFDFESEEVIVSQMARLFAMKSIILDVHESGFNFPNKEIMHSRFNIWVTDERQTTVKVGHGKTITEAFKNMVTYMVMFPPFVKDETGTKYIIECEEM